MPISDLLAQITGSTTPPPPSVPLKRRADDDGKGPAPKKTNTAPSKTSALFNGTQRPSHTTQNASASRPPAPPPSKTLSSTPSSMQKSSMTPSKSATRPPPASNNSKPLASPIVRQAPVTTANKAPPKKGSYAEIMARAAAAKATMGTVGQIQHKPLEKILGKQRQDPRGEVDPRTAKKGGPPPRAGYRGTAQANAPSAAPVGRPGARDVKNGGAIAKGSDSKKPVNGRGGKAVVEEKRVKKAALATTGYQGTASARPDTGKKGTPAGAASRGSDRVPFGGRRRPREEEEFDDFIEYDDEEEEEEAERYSRRYHYQSEDDESDMEAGLSDLDEEEQRAERLARQEDKREQEILDRHQREKLEKKRLFAARAAARR